VSCTRIVWRALAVALLLPIAAHAERLSADTSSTTAAGNKFIAPAGWNRVDTGGLTILEAPEAGSQVVLMDATAPSADSAVAKAWRAYKPDMRWPLKVASDAADKDGWTRTRSYEYITSPDEKRNVWATARFANGLWTVVIHDMTEAVGQKRVSQVFLIARQLLPKGYERESFAGRKPHQLDAGRIAELGRFVQGAQQQLGVPGVSVGLIQDGKVVFAGGFGVRELGKTAKVDADTKYMVASNTKALTTLMLGRLVEEKKLAWDTAAVNALPSFKLGAADTTSRVLVKHLICACTGMPRSDYEWLFGFRKATPDSTLATLGTIQPTSDFGALFQYSNHLAAAAGFLGGHVAFPKLELGRAYDEAMRTRVFQPLGMRDTTFDFASAQQGNFAASHAPDVDGRTAPAIHAVNYAVIAMRPTGGAWSNVRDMLKYVQMELNDGRLADGKQYMAKEVLLARRARQVDIDKDTFYGMGLTTQTRYGVTVVNHGGDMIGQHSDMIWLPEHGVGAVVLTNGDPGWFIRTIFGRKLLEVLFDGRPEADADLAAAGRRFFARQAAERKLFVIPPDTAAAGQLARRYVNVALGAIDVERSGAKTVFDFGDWKSEMASRANPDGTMSFVTIAPGVIGVEFTVRAGPKRALVLRDAQHEYVFEEI
jgi:CubicO group peptidase (beta-lactamase class C family)